MTKRRWYFLSTILIALLFSFSAGAFQAHNHLKSDSLRNVIQGKIGKKKIAAQMDLALELLISNPKEARQLSQLALSEAKEIGNLSLEMQANYLLGRVYGAMEQSPSSTSYYNKALSLADSIRDFDNKSEILFRLGVVYQRQGKDLSAYNLFSQSIQAGELTKNYRKIGASYSMLGTISRVNGWYDRAIEFIVKSKLNYQKANFKEGNAWAAYLLGRIYYDLKLPAKAMKYYQESLGIYKEISTKGGDLNGNAICYEQMAVINIEAGKLKEARNYIDSCRQIHEGKSKYGFSNVLRNLGRIEFINGNYKQASEHFNQAMQIKKEVNDFLSMPGLYLHMGLSLIKQGKTTKGLETINTGLGMAIKNNQKNVQIEIYSKLGELYLGFNNYNKALAYKDKQYEIQDSILSRGANIKYDQLQTIFEIDAQNSQIAALKNQNELNALSMRQNRIVRNAMLAGILLVLFILAAFIWFNYKIRHKNQQLYELNAAKDRFFAIISHDLRGPTSSLSSMLEHLVQHLNDFSGSELEEILLALNKSASNVSQLLENLLMWAKSQGNQAEYYPKVLNLSEVIQSSFSGLSQQALSKEVEVVFNTNDKIFVTADTNMLQTVFRNLIGNAIKFTKREGSVTISSEMSDSNRTIVKITDTGVGIDSKHLSTIFDITNTYHTRGTENEESTGLGLILVKDFVEKNNGNIDISSEKNRGTTVTLAFPLSPSEN